LTFETMFRLSKAKPPLPSSLAIRHLAGIYFG
jgi:hypothetical protein